MKSRAGEQRSFDDILESYSISKKHCEELKQSLDGVYRQIMENAESLSPKKQKIGKISGSNLGTDIQDYSFEVEEELFEGQDVVIRVDTSGNKSKNQILDFEIRPSFESEEISEVKLEEDQISDIHHSDLGFDFDDNVDMEEEEEKSIDTIAVNE